MKKYLIIIISLFTVVLANAQEKPFERFPDTGSLKINGVDSAKTQKLIKKNLPFAKEWKNFEWNGMKMLVGLSVLPSYGESYIDVHGYIYNKHFKEWRRFCVVKTRNLGLGEIGLDNKTKELYLLGNANNSMKGQRVFRYSLLLLSDDGGYVAK